MAGEIGEHVSEDFSELEKDDVTGEKASAAPIKSVRVGKRGLTDTEIEDLAERQKKEAEGFSTVEVSLERVAGPQMDGDRTPYPDGRDRSLNQEGRKVLRKIGESYEVSDADGASKQKLPFEYGLDPANGLHGEQSISWQWLDGNRIIGVQEAWRENDPDPLSGLESGSSSLAGSEITTSAPTCAFFFVFDTTKPGIIYQVKSPEMPSGYALRLDEILPGGIIELSACTPLAYHGIVADRPGDGNQQADPLKLGQFKIAGAK